MDPITSFIRSKLDAFKQSVAPAVQNVEHFASNAYNNPIVHGAVNTVANSIIPNGGLISDIASSPQVAPYIQNSANNAFNNVLTARNSAQNLAMGKGNISDIGKVTRGVGTVFFPEAAAVGGAFNAGLNTLGNLRANKPLTSNLQSSINQGVNFGAELGPLGEVAGALPGIGKLANIVPGEGKLSQIGGNILKGVGEQFATGTGYGLSHGQSPLQAIGTGVSFAPYGVMGGLNNLKSAPPDAEALKGVNPRAFNIDPKDMITIKNAYDVAKGFQEGDKNIAKLNIQKFLDQYAPGYSTSSMGKAYKVIENLIQTNEQVPQEARTPMPGMGLVDVTGGTTEPVEQAKSLVKNLKAGTNEPLTFPEEMDQLAAQTPKTTKPPMPKPGGDMTTPPITETAPAEVAKQARQAAFETQQNISYRAKNLSSQMRNTLKDYQDNLNFRLALEDPKGINEYAKTSSDPQAFKELAKNYSNFTDYVFGQAKDKKISLNYVEDYFTHLWDLSTPEARAKYEDILNYNAHNFQSGFTKERLISTIKQGLAAGLQFKNPSAADDVLQYANSMGRHISNEAFNQKINELRPGGAVPDVTGAATSNYKYKAYLQSNRPGNERTFIDPEIQKNMGFYNKSALQESPLIGGKDIQIGDKTIHVPGVDQINQLIKQSKLGGGGFHALNTTLREAVNDPLTIPTAVHNFLDDGANRAFQQKAINDGVIDFGSKVGVTFDTSGDVGKLNESLLSRVASGNPITRFSNRMFGNLIGTYKINLVRGMMDKFDLSDPEQLAQAKDYGSQINNLMGGINYEALGRNKTVQQAFRLVGLAPDFSEGTLKQLTTALNPAKYLNPISRPAAIFAARQVIGQVMLYAALAEVGRRLTTGSFSPDFKSLLANSILKPNIPLPNNPTFNSPKTGKPQSAFLPSSEAQTMLGAFNDPGHFLQARGSGIVSLGGSLLSGKDYYGNPLVNPWNGTPDNAVNRLKATLPGQLPIPVQQGIKALSANQTPKGGGAKVPVQTPAVTALNIAGLRVGNNPATAEAQQTTAYFKSLNDAANSLDPNEKAKFMGLLHPTTKDADGNPVVDKTPLTTPSQYDALLADPKLMAAEVAFQKSQPQHDPLWDLPQNQLEAYMHAQVISKNNPTSYLGLNDPTVKTLYASIDPTFFARRSAFFQSLQQQGIQLNSTSLPNTEPQDIQDWFTKHNALPTAKAKALDWQTPMGQKASAYMSQQANLTNQQRADMGLPLIAQTTGGSSSGGYSSAQKAFIRRQIRQVAKPRPRKAPMAKLPRPKRLSARIKPMPKIKYTSKAQKPIKLARLENPKTAKLKLKSG